MVLAGAGVATAWRMQRGAVVTKRLSPTEATATLHVTMTASSGRASEAAVLYRFTDRLFRAQTLQEIYEAGLDAICDGLTSSRASILRFDTDGIMRFVAWRGLSERYRGAVEGHSPWKPWERDADPIFVSDIRTSGEDPALVETVLAESIRALAFIPLADTAELLGKFMVYYDTPRVFTERERLVAQTISRQLGFAVDRYLGDASARRLSALVESSDDAIVAKDLNGIITDWNPGAERLFGYQKAHAVGQSIMLIIPEDRRHEEPGILERIRSGERIDHYETVRRRKDGSLVDISLTISPIRDQSGQVIGASKIARDISDRRRAEEQQLLLMHEMSHRIKNLFAIASSIVHLSAHSLPGSAEWASVVSERLSTLARAHSLTMRLSEDDGTSTTALHTLIETILAPYQAGDRRRFEIRGPNVAVPANLITPLSLLLHEFATNAAKYGSLSAPDGIVLISCSRRNAEFVIHWQESGGPVTQAPTSNGFGTKLVQATARQLGRLSYAWNRDGASIELVIATGYLEK